MQTLTISYFETSSYGRMGLKIIQSIVFAAVISQGAADVMTSWVPVSRTGQRLMMHWIQNLGLKKCRNGCISARIYDHSNFSLSPFFYYSNHCLIASGLPKSWKLSNMVPTPKNADPQENLYEMLWAHYESIMKDELLNFISLDEN